MSFYERYAECCRERGIYPASEAAAKQIGCTRSNISTFARTGATPRGEVVAGAARMLDVSADYLLGLIDTPKPIDGSMSDRDVEIMKSLRELNSDGIEAAAAALSGIASKERYKRSKEDKEHAGMKQD